MLTNKNVIGKQILDYIRQESGIVKLLYSSLAVNFFRHYISTKCIYKIIFRHVKYINVLFGIDHVHKICRNMYKKCTNT